MAAAARPRLSHLHRPPSSSPGQKSAVPGFLRSGALNYVGPHRSQTPGKTGGLGAASYQNCGGSTCFGAYVDELLSYTNNGTRYFTHSNHLYSPSAITNAAGQVQERYRYDAYGKQTITTATGTVRNQSAVGFSRGFTGYILDDETGLYYARTRMYSTSLGRFIGRDLWMVNHRPRSGGIIFVGRPSSLDGYRDGSNLYSAYFVPNFIDPIGEYKVEIPCPAGSGGRCGYIDIEVGKDVRARLTKDPKDCCYCCFDYGISQTMCTASGACYYDNSAVVFDRGQRHDDPDDRNPGENSRPAGGGNWPGNPWYPYSDTGGNGGGTTSNPVPQEGYGDAPDDPKFVLFIVQVLCRDTGEKVFEFRYNNDHGKYSHSMGDNWTW